MNWTKQRSLINKESIDDILLKHECVLLSMIPIKITFSFLAAMYCSGRKSSRGSYYSELEEYILPGGNVCHLFVSHVF